VQRLWLKEKQLGFASRYLRALEQLELLADLAFFWPEIQTIVRFKSQPHNKSKLIILVIRAMSGWIKSRMKARGRKRKTYSFVFFSLKVIKLKFPAF
jgi:hypothetical protein